MTVIFECFQSSSHCVRTSEGPTSSVDLAAEIETLVKQRMEQTGDTESSASDQRSANDQQRHSLTSASDQSANNGAGSGEEGGAEEAKQKTLLKRQ